MTMGDRVAVMRKGELQQVADPQTLYDHPVNLFVGGFIGSPSMNMLEATVQRQNGSLALSLGSQQLPLDEAVLGARPALARYEGRELVVGIRPEYLEDPAFAHEGLPRLRGKVGLREALGSEIMVHVEIDARPAMTEDVRELKEDAGADMPEAANETTIVGRFNARSRVRTGETTDLAVDTSELHFFDPGSGLGIYSETTTGEDA
jgi:multiple sugar transport system ATP-binding protein